MNKVILMGRLTRDPNVTYTQGADSRAVARFSVAVDRRVSKNNSNGQQTADFISCVAFGNTAQFVEKYIKKGTKIVLSGRIQTGQYTDRDGKTVYTTDVVAEDVEFAESKNASGNNGGDFSYNAGSHGNAGADAGDGFNSISDGVDEDLPFI